jgi:hypothetical protein
LVEKIQRNIDLITLQVLAGSLLLLNGDLINQIEAFSRRISNKVSMFEKISWRSLIDNFRLIIALLNSNDIPGMTPVTCLYSMALRCDNMRIQGGQGQFEWINGSLIRAVQEGRWMLLENVNFCAASVLDRLNSLFENNGSLMVNERGLVDGAIQVIKPHPNFRLFMTMNEAYGEISRAMRNRAVEMYMNDESNLEGFDNTENLNCGTIASETLTHAYKEIGFNNIDSFFTFLNEYASRGLPWLAASQNSITHLLEPTTDLKPFVTKCYISLLENGKLSYSVPGEFLQRWGMYSVFLNIV